MGERVCKWCGVDISLRKKIAKFCGSKCKDLARYEKRHGVPPGPFLEKRKCQVCRSSFDAKTSTRLYCGKVCRQAAQLEKGRESNTARARKYREEKPEKYRQADALRRLCCAEKFRDQSRARYAKIKSECPERYFEILEKAKDDSRARYNEMMSLGSTLSLAHTLYQIKTGDLSNDDHEPE